MLAVDVAARADHGRGRGSVAGARGPVGPGAGRPRVGCARGGGVSSPAGGGVWRGGMGGFSGMAIPRGRGEGGEAAAARGTGAVRPGADGGAGGAGGPGGGVEG